MSTEGGPVFTFSFPGGGAARPLVSYTTAPNSNWFLYKFDCLPVLVIATEYPISIFGFVQCKYIWFRWQLFPNNRSFGMGMTFYSCITPSIAQK